MKQQEPAVRLLWAAVLMILPCVHCSTHIVDRGNREKIDSEVVSQEQRLELVSEPTLVNPTAKLRSLEETQYRETFHQTTLFKREPSPWLRLGLLGTSLGAFLLAKDMTDRGFPEYATPTVTGGLVAAGGLGLSYVIPLFNRRKVERTEETRIDRKPLPVDVSIGSELLTSLHPDAQCYASLSFLTYLDQLPRGRNFNVAARISDMPQHSTSFVVGKEMTLHLEKERREEEERRERVERERCLAEERKKQEEREKQRQKEIALARAAGSLDTWDIARLRTAFRYASAGFQYMVTQEALGEALGVATYGDFLDLPLRSQVWALREIARVYGGGYAGSVLVQELLSIPAYLAAKVLR